jgi:hypothetical protein
MRALAIGVIAIIAAGCASRQVSVNVGAISRRAAPEDLFVRLGDVEGRHCNKALSHPANLREAVIDAEKQIEGTDALLDATIAYESSFKRDCFVVKGEAVRIGK